MLSSPSASQSRPPAAAAGDSQGALTPGSWHSKPWRWPPSKPSTHSRELPPSSAPPIPPTGPTASPRAPVRAVLDRKEPLPDDDGDDDDDNAGTGHYALESMPSQVTRKEPVIRLGPGPRAPSRPTSVRRPPFNCHLLAAPVPKTPTSPVVTSMGTVTATSDAVILPHHGHPHCSSTESGSPLLGVGVGVGCHWHRPIALRELVSSLSPSPSPAHSPAPQFPPPPAVVQSPKPLNPLRVQAPLHVQQARPQQQATSLYRTPPPPPPSIRAGAATGTPATRPPRGIFAPTPAPLPALSPATTGKSKPAGVRARHASTTQSPSRSPATSAINTSSPAALPLPPRDAGGRWRRKTELPSASASASATPARQGPSPYARQPVQFDPHTHPARKHVTNSTSITTAAHVGSPPLTPKSVVDTPSLSKTVRRPPISPHLPTFPSAAGAGLVQLPSARTRARTASTSSSISDATTADRSVVVQPMFHPTPSSSDELTDPATSSSDADDDADADDGEHAEQDISSDTCALCNRQSVPSPSKLPAIVAQSPFPQPASADASSSASSASTKKSVTHWAGCDFCPRWYHCACLGVPHRIVSKLAKLACPVCAAEHAHACKVKEKEAKRVAEQVGAWVKQVYAARMAKGKKGTAKNKIRKRRQRHSVTPNTDAVASIVSDPMVSCTLHATQDVMQDVDQGAVGWHDPNLRQGQGDVIALPPLTRRGGTRRVERRKRDYAPRRLRPRSRIRGHTVDGETRGHISVGSGESAPVTDVESGSGSAAETNEECDEEEGRAEVRADMDSTEVSECESNYSGSVCSTLFVAGAGCDALSSAETYYDAHSHPHGFQSFSSALARRSLSPSEVTEAEYSCPASPDGGTHPFAGYNAHSPPTFTTAASSLDTLLAAANVVAVTDAVSASSSSVEPINPLASLASVASMMLLSDGHELKSDVSAPEPSDDTLQNKLLILADSAWASSLELNMQTTRPLQCGHAIEGTPVVQDSTHLPPTPVSASECDTLAAGSDHAQRVGDLKRPREEIEVGVECKKLVHGETKRLKTCDADAMASLERMQAAGLSPAPL